MRGAPLTDIRLHMIHYDEASRAAVAAPYLPLDNANGPEGWFEFWPIYAFLRDAALEDDVWYGFVSPRFEAKAGVAYGDVAKILQSDPEAEVALFSHSWSELAYHRNPWEQAELWHPGVTALTEAFLREAGIDFDIQATVTDMETSVFSNYILAKRRFWEDWFALADAYFGYVEAEGPDGPHSRMTRHRGVDAYAMKTFVQERFASIVLTRSAFRTVRADYAALPARLIHFPDTRATRTALIACDRAKSAYRASGDPRDLDAYVAARRAIDRARIFAKARGKIRGALRRLTGR